MGDFSHLNETGEAAMVDVTGKVANVRSATVGSYVHISPGCTLKLTDEAVSEIQHTARIAGIQASKQTSTLIPLCHQVSLNKTDLEISLDRHHHQFKLTARTKTSANTGVEMEAFVAVSIAALTIYDMIKAVCPEACIEHTHLIEKKGGRHGLWERRP
jgi:cyclic pyranopterin phosphate synthase